MSVLERIANFLARPGIGWALVIGSIILIYSGFLYYLKRKR